MPTLPGPFQLQDWIEQHRHLLQPPVGNKVIWRDADFIVMAVGGPNQRNDFHYEEGPELFYQLEGAMELIIMDQGQRQHVPIKAGEIYLLPPRVPHSPQRQAHSVGLVVERRRLAHEQDGLLWFCPQCDHKIYEEYFTLTDIETQFASVFEHFNANPDNRRCSNCGAIHPEA
ncbi:MAG: 3-hydroxyanthranilate 3,4-dioxygenase [Wenzhouxiangellaceae bacterium]